MTTNPHNRHYENYLITLTITVYAILSFISLRWYSVFLDEPGYSDPAVSMLMGQGFTSGAWYAQGYEDFWAGNVPLHQACLYLWMKMFGVGQVAIRSINILFIIIGIGLGWAGIRRLEIIKTSGVRLAVVILVLCSHAGAILVNLGRPDAICMALAGFLIFAFSIGSKGLRYALIGLVGVAAPWAGLPLAVVCGLAGVMLLLFYRRIFLGEVTCLALGGVAGVISLLFLYHYHGVIDAFLQSIAPHNSFIKSYSSTTQNLFIKKTNGVVVPPSVELKQRLGAFTDYTFLCLLGATFFAWLGCIRKSKAVPLLALSFISVAVVPILLAGTGVFPIYYAWYALVPGLIALMAMWERGLICNRPLQVGVMVSLVSLILIGFPRVWVNGFIYRADDVNGKAERFVASVINNNDVVLVQPQAWHGAKPVAHRVYHSLRAPSLTTSEAQSITAVISSPVFFHAQREILKGEWKETGERLSLPNRNTHRLPFSKWFRDHPTIELHVFRRVHH